MVGTIGNIATIVGFLALVINFSIEKGIASRLLGVMILNFNLLSKADFFILSIFDNPIN